MRQLQMLDEPGRLDVVGMRQHEFLVLRRRRTLLAELIRRSARSTSAIAIALRSSWPNTSP